MTVIFIILVVVCVLVLGVFIIRIINKQKFMPPNIPSDYLIAGKMR